MTPSNDRSQECCLRVSSVPPLLALWQGRVRVSSCLAVLSNTSDQMLIFPGVTKGQGHCLKVSMVLPMVALWQGKCDKEW